MIREMKRQFVLQGRDWLGLYLVMAAAGICGTVLLGGVFGIGGKSGDLAAAGTLVAAMTLLLIVIFAGAFQILAGFRIALSMGGTRKWYLLTYYLQLVVGTLVGGGLLTLLYKIETMLTKASESKPLLANIPVKDPLLYVLVLVLILTAAATFFGTLILRFGKKAFWVLWCLWMAGTLGVPAMLGAAKNTPGSILGIIGTFLINVFGGLASGTIIIILLLIWLICLAGSYTILRKQQI